ncbi:hypothetical protein [Clostridium botulinum]|uniref:hypothetical protein n=1 Tax=Clostridium botulinum TaxID=1491 RepID=UPI0018A6C512|nr:hypothetical protein [Clostridium botulinum]
MLDEFESFGLLVVEYDPLLNPFEAPLLVPVESLVVLFMSEEFVLLLFFVSEKLPDLNPSALLSVVFFLLELLELLLSLEGLLEEELLKLPDLNPLELPELFVLDFELLELLLLVLDPLELLPLDLANKFVLVLVSIVLFA